jgi:hypothetical protein
LSDIQFDLIATLNYTEQCLIQVWTKHMKAIQFAFRHPNIVKAIGITCAAAVTCTIINPVISIASPVVTFAINNIGNIAKTLLAFKAISLNHDQGLKALEGGNAAALDTALEVSTSLSAIPYLADVTQAKIDITGKLNDALQDKNYKVAEVLLKHSANANDDLAGNGIKPILIAQNNFITADDDGKAAIAPVIIKMMEKGVVMNSAQAGQDNPAQTFFKSGISELMKPIIDNHQSAILAPDSTGNTVAHYIAASPNLMVSELGAKLKDLPIESAMTKSNSVGKFPLDFAAHKAKEHQVGNLNHFVDKAVSATNVESSHTVASDPILLGNILENRDFAKSDKPLKLLQSGIVATNAKDATGKLPVERFAEMESGDHLAAEAIRLMGDNNEFKSKLLEIDPTNGQNIIKLLAKNNHKDAYEILKNKLGKDGVAELFGQKTDTDGRNGIIQMLDERAMNPSSNRGMDVTMDLVNEVTNDPSASFMTVADPKGRTPLEITLMDGDIAAFSALAPSLKKMDGDSIFELMTKNKGFLLAAAKANPDALQTLSAMTKELNPPQQEEFRNAIERIVKKAEILSITESKKGEFENH